MDAPFTTQIQSGGHETPSNGPAGPQTHSISTCGHQNHMLQPRIRLRDPETRDLHTSWTLKQGFDMTRIVHLRQWGGGNTLLDPRMTFCHRDTRIGHPDTRFGPGYPACNPRSGLKTHVLPSNDHETHGARFPMAHKYHFKSQPQVATRQTTLMPSWALALRILQMGFLDPILDVCRLNTNSAAVGTRARAIP